MLSRAGPDVEGLTSVDLAPERPELIVQVPDFLSVDECRKFIEIIDRVGLNEASAKDKHPRCSALKGPFSTLRHNTDSGKVRLIWTGRMQVFKTKLCRSCCGIVWHPSSVAVVHCRDWGVDECAGPHCQWTKTYRPLPKAAVLQVP